MGRSGVRGERSRPSDRGGAAAHAGDLGWDESLYQDTGDAAPGPDERRPRGNRHKGGRTKRSGFRILRWTAGTLAVLVLATAGAGYLWYRHLNSNIKTDKLNIGEHKAAKPTPNAAGQTPLNILLIGSDSRNSKENLKLGGSKASVGAAPLADVQMLLHLSADRTNMSVVSMPRDTLARLPKCTDPEDGKVYEATATRQMVNTSLGRGGPGCTVATWEEMTGIHIDHFMMVDFSGVVSMADAVGGVPVCVSANVYSRNSRGEGSGLKLKEGTTSVKGEQALAWLRTRHGFEDGSDIARAKAQHMYMSSMVRELRKNATFSHPNALRTLAEKATKALHVDDGLDTVKKLYDLSNELKKPDPSRITMTTMPFVYVGARVAPKEHDADALWRLIKDDVSLDGKDKKKKSQDETSDDPAAADDKIAVQVLNGTRTATTAPVPGRASQVAQALVAKGFTKAVRDQSQSLAEEKTVLRYPSSDLEGDAQAVAKSLGIPLSSVKKSTDVSGVTLTVGADWTTGNAYPKSAGDEDASKALDKEQTQNGADDSKCMKVEPGYTW
ncbi:MULTISPECIES: LCP family protein [unclassified Streptomyces]|uniref:LCP family protein n=1 Tax=unclassified Streptomyces TaxID=2593676 RepID=UPI000DC4EF38|nr:MULTISPECIES: LCP family protein [unclassified Streptomyces]RAJ79399.1 LytR family transcriptional attenuator [Streptomyces sp. PsTaAH-137]